MCSGCRNAGSLGQRLPRAGLCLAFSSLPHQSLFSAQGCNSFFFYELPVSFCLAQSAQSPSPTSFATAAAGFIQFNT